MKCQIQTDFEKRLNVLHRVRCCINQTKVETFASYAHLGTNQAHVCSSKNSIYWLNLNCIVRDLSCMHAKQNSAINHALNSVLFISVQTFLAIKMILQRVTPGGGYCSIAVLCYNRNQLAQ